MSNRSSIVSGPQASVPDDSGNVAYPRAESVFSLPVLDDYMDGISLRF